MTKPLEGWKKGDTGYQFHDEVEILATFPERMGEDSAFDTVVQNHHGRIYLTHTDFISKTDEPT